MSNRRKWNRRNSRSTANTFNNRNDFINNNNAGVFASTRIKRGTFKCPYNGGVALYFCRPFARPKFGL